MILSKVIIMKLKSKFILIMSILMLIIILAVFIHHQKQSPVEKYMQHYYKNASYKTMELVDIAEYKDYKLELYTFNKSGTVVCAFLLKKDSKNNFTIVQTSDIIQNFKRFYIFDYCNDVDNDVLTCILSDGTPKSVKIDIDGELKNFDMDKEGLGGYIFELENSTEKWLNYTFYDENGRNVNGTD